MRIINGRPPRARYLARGGAELNRAARLRLQWMDYYQSHGRNAALTCRHFGISRQSFYRWKRRYDPENLVSLEDRSHRPHRRRQLTWTPELAERVLRLPAAVSPLGQGQAGGPAAAGRQTGVHFDGRANSRSSEAARPAGGTLAGVLEGATSRTVSPLRRPQAAGVSAPNNRATWSSSTP